MASSQWSFGGMSGGGSGLGLDDLFAAANAASIANANNNTQYNIADLQGQYGLQNTGLGGQYGLADRSLQNQNNLQLAGVNNTSAQQIAAMNNANSLQQILKQTQAQRDIANIQRQGGTDQANIGANAQLRTAKYGLQGQQYTADQQRAAQEAAARYGLLGTQDTNATSKYNTGLNVLAQNRATDAGLTAADLSSGRGLQGTLANAQAQIGAAQASAQPGILGAQNTAIKNKALIDLLPQLLAGFGLGGGSTPAAPSAPAVSQNTPADIPSVMASMWARNGGSPVDQANYARIQQVMKGKANPASRLPPWQAQQDAARARVLAPGMPVTPIYALGGAHA